MVDRTSARPELEQASDPEAVLGFVEDGGLFGRHPTRFRALEINPPKARLVQVVGGFEVGVALHVPSAYATARPLYPA